MVCSDIIYVYMYFFCQEQWKTSSHTPGKRKDRSKNEDEEGGSEKRRKGNKRRKDQRTKTQYGEDEEDEYRDEPEAEDDYANLSRDNDGDNSERAPDHLAAAGLEDSDAEDDMVRVVLFLVNNLCSLFFYLLFSLFMCFLSADTSNIDKHSIGKFPFPFLLI